MELTLSQVLKALDKCVSLGKGIEVRKLVRDDGKKILNDVGVRKQQ